ncbi:MAG: hypothetical protein PHX83_12605 [Acidobacteriia bacterium]|nr:hypothetical protein [Terriglobia bacterium]
MIKSKLILLCAATVLALVLTVPMNADWGMSQKDRNFYTNNPCSSPFISWALWNLTAGFNRPTGGIGTSGDCDPSNYGTWTTAPQLESNLHAYLQLMSRQGVSLSVFMGRDNHAYIAVKNPSGVLFGIDGGYVVAQGGGNVVAQGGGNIVAASNVVAQGGGNVVAQGGGNVVAQGGGNFRGVQSTGTTVVQFPGKWVQTGPNTPAPAPQQPYRPITPPVQQPYRPITPPVANRSGMITTSYERAFGRAPSPAELAYWNGLPASDSRVANINNLLASHQTYLRSNAAERQGTISRSYMAVFRRNPNSGEMRYWDQQVASTGATYEQLVSLNQQYKAQHPNFR